MALTIYQDMFSNIQQKDSTSSSSKRTGDSLPKKKDKRKGSTKDRGDRSKAYEYSYESTYLGGQSRHASLEDMNMHAYGYRWALLSVFF